MPLPCGILLNMGGYFNSASDGLLLLLRRYTNQRTRVHQVDSLESHPDLTSLFATPWTLFAAQVPLLIPRWRDRDSHGPPGQRPLLCSDHRPALVLSQQLPPTMSHQIPCCHSQPQTQICEMRAASLARCSPAEIQQRATLSNLKPHNAEDP